MNLSDEYLIAWSIYFTAGAGCWFAWWKMTRIIANRGVRDILRGIAAVLIFTPWYAGETPEFWAPAVVVLLMDVLLEGTASGLKGGVALLMATFLMLIVLVILEFTVHRRRKPPAGEPGDLPESGLAN